MTTTATSETMPFEDHLREAVQSMRVAFMSLLASVGADPTTPQDVARRFGMDKNLAWKISKVVQTDEPEVAASHLPGIAGLRIFIAAMKQSGGDASALADAEEAIAGFERMVEIHTTDRATLEMLLSASRATNDPKRAEAHRKQAYNGNSVIWGVQAETRLASYFMAPNADDPDMLDFGVIGGLVNYRRLRSGASWPLVRTEVYDDEGQPMPDPAEPMDPDGVVHIAGPHGDVEFPMIREFSSDPAPEITVTATRLGTQYQIGPGPVGNAGSASCIFGKIARAAHPVHGTAENGHGENFTWLFTPSEWVMVDVFMHRAIPIPMPCEVGLYGTISAIDISSEAERGPMRLPLAERLQALGPAPNIVTPLVPDYPRLLRHVFDRCDWDPTEFRGYRFQMRYPPIPTALLFKYDLPIRS